MMKFPFKNKPKKVKNCLEELLNGDREYIQARHIILNDLKANLDGEGISSKSNKHIHAVIAGTDRLCVSLARQIALVVHYPNFDDNTGKNRGIITFLITQPASNGPAALFSSLKENTGNLLDECQWKITRLANGSMEIIDKCPHSKEYIDIEFEIISAGSISEYIEYISSEENSLTTFFCNKGTLDSACRRTIEGKFHNLYEINRESIDAKAGDGLIDTTAAQWVNAIYIFGGSFKEIKTRDIYNVKNYNSILSQFINIKTDVSAEWEKIGSANYTREYINSLKLSNVYCADTFMTKRRSITSSDAYKHKKTPFSEIIHKQIKQMAYSEHTRWNVEKLMNGFRAYTALESYDDEFGLINRKEHKVNNMAHINICSGDKLLRIDSESFKYDCFMVFAFNNILEKLK